MIRPSDLFFVLFSQIKKRKIFVVSTPKRPIPLEHYLYTGYDGKTKHSRFLIVDKSGKFLNQGYNKAVEAVKERTEKSKGAPKSVRIFATL